MPAVLASPYERWHCCSSRCSALFSFMRRFFSPEVHKWQNSHLNPFPQPFV